MQRHPHDWDNWPRDGNLGDCMQTLGVENVYHKLFASMELPFELLTVHRDDIGIYDGQPVKLVMQSWFGDYAGVFPLPWSSRITPVFIGFHLNTINETRQRFRRENIHEMMKPYQPIGCRDRNTRDFLIECGLDAYFSGCMTLTFDKRESSPVQGKIFIVDLTEKTKSAMPDELMAKADHSITHFYYWNEYPVTEKGAVEFEQEARHILKRYREEAALVITSKIHVAMPCVAMGIPVVFIHEEADSNERFDVLQGILPLYTPDDIPYIDWDVQPVNIDELKQAIIRNAHAQITNSPKARQTREELDLITKKLNAISIKWLLEHRRQLFCTYFRVLILSFLTWGKKRGKYKEKKRFYYNLLRRGRQFLGNR